jgi:O-acetyl-ADP-ribose deacetylase (regulator of RNase III)
MPLQIIRNDITKIECDAIVNAANCTLLGGGGVDGAIHRAAGRGLLRECETLGGCETGQAKITNGYDLPCKYVIHTVGPVWQGGIKGEREQLENCYKNSLLLAKENNCESVAFPLISTGVYGYPMDDAMKVAVDTIGSFLLHNDMLVYIVVYNKVAVNVGNKLFADIAEYIDDNYVAEHTDYNYESARMMQCNMPLHQTQFLSPCVSDDSNIDDWIKDVIDESFSEMLLRKIDESGMTDSECYKKANIDRKLFSKIRSNPQYKPSKTTAIAFAIALELSLDETKELLMKAGFALSHSNKFDVIIEYFITKGNYNIFEINETLFAFDQCLLGV